MQGGTDVEIYIPINHDAKVLSKFRQPQGKT